jgi:hypothetical protein
VVQQQQQLYLQQDQQHCQGGGSILQTGRCCPRSTRRSSRLHARTCGDPEQVLQGCGSCDLS